MSIEMTNGLVEMSGAEMATVVGGLRSANQLPPSCLTTAEFSNSLLSSSLSGASLLASTSPDRKLVIDTVQCAMPDCTW